MWDPASERCSVTSLAGRPNTALVVIDMQKDVVADAPRVDEVVANIRDLIGRARRAGVPVVWVQHSDKGMVEGSDGWQYVSELRWEDGEPLVHKRYNDSFEDTEFEAILAGLGIGHLVVTGAQSDACIRATLHGAFVRGYDATLVSDAHTTEDLRPWGATFSPEQAIDHTNLYWEGTSAPGRNAAVQATAQVDFSTG